MTSFRSITVTWGENDTPIAEQFGDPYFSREDGREETRHVFLEGNGLPDRFAVTAEFTIAELGFGTGLNFFETAAAWRRARRGISEPAKLTYVAFERFPLAASDLERAISRWPELGDDLKALLEQWPPAFGFQKISLGEVSLELAVGDANIMVPKWPSKADAWYLDGFSPAKNPDMWGEDLLKAVFAHTNADGTFATFTVAGWVRRNLQQAGFSVMKTPGYGRKRECCKGVKTNQ